MFLKNTQSLDTIDWQVQAWQKQDNLPAYWISSKQQLAMNYVKNGSTSWLIPSMHIQCVVSVTDNRGIFDYGTAMIQPIISHMRRPY